MSNSKLKTARATRIALAATLALGASACSYDAADLRDYVAEVKSRPGGALQPPPAAPEFEEIPLISQESDPFQSFLARELGATPVPAPEPPWPPHNPEELEGYALDSLRMVGTLERQNTQWALVRDPAGVVHRVRSGNYMGENYGKILDVSENRIQLLEKVWDGHGNWTEREAQLALSE